MLQALKEACHQTSPITTRDGVTGASVMIGLTAFLTLVGVILDRTGYEATGEFVILFGFFVALQVSMLWTYLKGKPAGIQAILAGGPLVVVAAILAGSMWLNG